MIHSDIHIDKYDWDLSLYVFVTKYRYSEILTDLHSIGARLAILNKADRLMGAGRLNTGLTYSNPDHYASVMVISETTTPSELISTINHERLHLVDAISKEFGFGLDTEEAAYLIGETAIQMYDAIKCLLH